MIQRKIETSDSNKDYLVMITDDFSLLPSILDKFDNKRKVCIVTDTNVEKIYLSEISSLLIENGYTPVPYVFEAGESQKNLSNVESLYECLISNFFDRNDFVLALGGGVTGDLAGFAAATYLRGIRYIGVPTSLLSMVDSSVGGKTGVDFKAFKNIVGAFYQPSAVYINTSTLFTLPDRELRAGMGEVLKHALIKDSDYLSFLLRNSDGIKQKRSDLLLEMIDRSIQIKGAVVAKDTYEKGERAKLNFGHTLGHAIEKLSHFQYLHGECVALGMLSAVSISFQRGYLSEQEVNQIKQAYECFSLLASSQALNENELLSVCHHDKKSDGEQINFVLLKSIGNAFITKDVSDQEILTAFSELL